MSDPETKSQPNSPVFTPIRMISSLNTPNTSLSGTPLNTSAVSWKSNSSSPQKSNFLSNYLMIKRVVISFLLDLNVSYSPSERSYMYRPITAGQSPMLLPPKDTPTVQHITDVNTLNEYLKDFSKTEKLSSTFNMDTSTNILNSFWSHPVTKSAKDTSMFLRNTFYQLSTHSPGSSTIYIFLSFLKM